MPIYSLGDQRPSIHESAFVHPDAVVIGSVTIGAESSIWPGAVLRGDDGLIQIGEQSNVQDNCVIHTTAAAGTVVGDRCVIAHLVHLEGCTIEDDSMVANAAMVLHRSIVRSGAIVAANSVVRYDVEVPSGALAVGTPAVIKPDKARREMIQRAAQNYVRRARRYRSELVRLD